MYLLAHGAYLGCELLDTSATWTNRGLLGLGRVDFEVLWVKGFKFSYVGLFSSSWE